MLRLFLVLLLVSLACSSFHRLPRLSDPLALGELGWELQELQVEDYVKGSAWPKPQGESPSGTVYKLTPQDFKFAIVGESSDVLEDAIARYKDLTFPDNVGKSKKHKKHKKHHTLSQITELAIKVLDKYEDLTLESDESCKYKCLFNLRKVKLIKLFCRIF